MSVTEEEIVETFGNRLRVRVCGICTDGDKILMIKHHFLGNDYLWSPPGGGLKYGETSEEALKREFLEETGLYIQVGEFLFIHEFLEKPLHAIELFFNVSIESGSLKKGIDPEMPTQNQIIAEVTFLNFSDLKNEKPNNVHRIFQKCNDINDIFKLKGIYHT